MTENNVTHSAEARRTVAVWHTHVEDEKPCTSKMHEKKKRIRPTLQVNVCLSVSCLFVCMCLWSTEHKSKNE